MRCESFSDYPWELTAEGAEVHAEERKGSIFSAVSANPQSLWFAYSLLRPRRREKALAFSGWKDTKTRTCSLSATCQAVTSQKFCLRAVLSMRKLWSAATCRRFLTINPTSKQERRQVAALQITQSE